MEKQIGTILGPASNSQPPSPLAPSMEVTGMSSHAAMRLCPNDSHRLQGCKQNWQLKDLGGFCLGLLLCMYVCYFITFGQKFIVSFYFDGLFSKWHCKRNKPECVVRLKEMRMLLGLQREGTAKLKGPGQVQMAEAGAGVRPGSLLRTSGSYFSCAQKKRMPLWSLCLQR